MPAVAEAEVATGVGRDTSKRCGSGKTAGSWFAAKMFTVMSVPAGMTRSRYSTSAVAFRSNSHDVLETLVTEPSKR